jgi:hypothetical protein
MNIQTPISAHPISARWPATRPDVIQLYRSQGEVLAYEMFMTIPEVLIANKEANLDNEQKR